MAIDVDRMKGKSFKNKIILVAALGFVAFCAIVLLGKSAWRTYKGNSLYEEAEKAQEIGDWDTAIKCYFEATEYGHVKAFEKRGDIYDKGLNGVQGNDLKAIEWWSKALDEGVDGCREKINDAYNSLGFKALRRREYEDAVIWLTKAAEDGFVESQVLLARVYSGNYDNKSQDDKFKLQPAEAYKWAMKAIKGNEAIEKSGGKPTLFIDDAYFIAGAACLKGEGTKKDLDEANRLLLFAHKRDERNKWTMAYLGDLYSNPDFKGKDLDKAIEWYEMATTESLMGGRDERNYAQPKLIAILFDQGKAYETGNGYPKDQAKAQGYYKKAAAKGHVEAKYKIGDYQGVIGDDKNQKYPFYVDAVYKRGEQVETNGRRYGEKEPVFYYKWAAEHGHKDAIKKYAHFLMTGYSVKKDTKEASVWYQKIEGTEKIDSEGNYALGLYYKDKDAVKSFTYYKAALDGTNTAAQLPLALCYAHGKGCEKNGERAMELIKAVIDKGDIRGIRAIGILADWYAKGTCMDKNIDKACELYLEAANKVLKYEGSVQGKDTFALSMLKTAADLNNAKACYWIYEGYNRRYWTANRDDALAEKAKYWNKAVELGHPKANYEKGRKYLNTKTREYTENDILNAIACFKIAASGGHEGVGDELYGAYLKLAKIYHPQYTDIGKMPDREAKAIEYYTLALGCAVSDRKKQNVQQQIENLRSAQDRKNRISMPSARTTVPAGSAATTVQPTAQPTVQSTVQPTVPQTVVNPAATTPAVVQPAAPQPIQDDPRSRRRTMRRNSIRLRTPRVNWGSLLN